MKNLIFITIVLFAFQAQAQLTLEGKQYVYHKSYRAKGTQEKLYKKASEFVMMNFNDGKNQVQLNDAESNQILVLGKWKHEVNGSINTISYLYKVEFLNGMYRESFKDMSYQAKGKDFPLASKKVPGRKDVVSYTNKKIQALSHELHAYMHTELVSMLTK